MQVFLPIVAFSLQIVGSGRPVLTKGKFPKRSRRTVLPIFRERTTKLSNTSIFQLSLLNFNTLAEKMMF